MAGIDIKPLQDYHLARPMALANSSFRQLLGLWKGRCIPSFVFCVSVVPLIALHSMQELEGIG
jgi:hypothetical protein